MASMLYFGGWLWLAAASSVGTSLADRPVSAVAEQPSPRIAGSFVDLGQLTTPAGTRIRRSGDGLFYVNALVNGSPVRFLVDTGASMVVLAPADAQRVGVMPSVGGFDRVADTPGGRTTFAMVELNHLAVGQVEDTGVHAAVASAELPTSLLGQSWLSRMRSVTITGDTMILQ